MKRWSLLDWFAVGYVLGLLIPARKPRPPEPIAVALLIAPAEASG